MNLKRTLGQIDMKNIYNHVLKLEGIRNPLDMPERLDKAADYLVAEFGQYGLHVNQQKFTVDGFAGTFRNIEASIEADGRQELIVAAHYDTQIKCPGANDNASGIAVILEIARILAQEDCGRRVRFIGFTLEELNPSYKLKERRLAQKLGIIDGQGRYSSLHVHLIMKQLNALRIEARKKGRNIADSWKWARASLENHMNEPELVYASEMEKMYEGISLTSWPGKTGLIGSDSWAEKFAQSDRVLGVLCLDEVGYVSCEERSQKTIDGTPRISESNKVTDMSIGDFVEVIASSNSHKLVQSFRSQVESGFVDLKYVCRQIDMSYEEIAKTAYDMLMSDHAVFWRKGIPALCLTDTTKNRYPYYHTEADTIDKLDFKFLTKICKATMATAIDLTR